MKHTERKKFWNEIYHKKNTTNFSWFEKKPKTSLRFLKKFKLPLTAKIIDIGGGDSFFVDNLLEMGYQDITVLDVSNNSLDKAKQRLGLLSNKIKWINSDVSDFKPDEKYDFWHDRATFHFLTKEKEIRKYINTINNFIKPKGYLVLGTFSEKGPEICSGLKIKQYSENTMTDRLKKFFKKIKCITVEHMTPFNTIQNFIFCSFQRQLG